MRRMYQILRKFVFACLGVLSKCCLIWEDMAVYLYDPEFSTTGRYMLSTYVLFPIARISDRRKTHRDIFFQTGFFPNSTMLFS